MTGAGTHDPTVRPIRMSFPFFFFIFVLTINMTFAFKLYLREDGSISP